MYLIPVIGFDNLSENKDPNTYYPGRNWHEELVFVKSSRLEKWNLNQTKLYINVCINLIIN